MDKTVAIVCHSFFQRCTPEQQKVLLQFLPTQEAEAMAAMPETEGKPIRGFPAEEEALDKIHYSWFAPYLRTLPENEIRWLLSCLLPEQAKGLKQQLLFSNHLPQLSELASVFFRQTLLDAIAPKELLPPVCLPKTPLNILLHLSHADLLSLIDLLAMHDLTNEIRHVIDTIKLKQIYSLLSKAQQTYLKTLSLKKEPVAFKKIGLNNWNGDTEALRAILLQRGINRLAKALYGHDESLLWYITHILDSERGINLKKLCQPLDHPKAASLLSEQICDLADAIRNHNPA